jgi:hypothetical protein
LLSAWPSFSLGISSSTNAQWERVCSKEIVKNNVSCSYIICVTKASSSCIHTLCPDPVSGPKNWHT